MDFTPAFLGDAALNATIRFRLPAAGGGLETYTGRLTAFDRGLHAVGVRTIAFRIDSADRTFTCRPDLHIDLHTEETR